MRGRKCFSFSIVLSLNFLLVCVPLFSQESSEESLYVPLSDIEATDFFSGLQHLLNNKASVIYLVMDQPTADPQDIREDSRIFLLEQLHQFSKTLTFDHNQSPEKAVFGLEKGLAILHEIQDRIMIMIKDPNSLLTHDACQQVVAQLKDMISVLDFSIHILRRDSTPLYLEEFDFLKRNFLVTANEAQDTVQAHEIQAGAFAHEQRLSQFFIKALLADYFDMDPDQRGSHQIRMDQDQGYIRLTFFYHADGKTNILPWQIRERLGRGLAVFLAIKYFEQKGAHVQTLRSDAQEVIGYSIEIPFCQRPDPTHMAPVSTKESIESTHEWISLTQEETNHIFSGVGDAATDMIEIIAGELMEESYFRTHPIQMRLFQIASLLSLRDSYQPQSPAEFRARLVEAWIEAQALRRELRGLSLGERARVRILREAGNLENLLDNTIYVLKNNKVHFDPKLLESMGKVIETLELEPEIHLLLEKGRYFEIEPNRFTYYWMVLLSDFYHTQESLKSEKPIFIVDSVNNELVLRFDYQVRAYTEKSWTVPWAVSERMGSGLPMALAKIYFEHHLGAIFEVLLDEHRNPVGYRVRIPYATERGPETSLIQASKQLSGRFNVMNTKIEDFSQEVANEFPGRTHIPEAEFLASLERCANAHSLNFENIGVDPKIIARKLSKFSDLFPVDRGLVLKAFFDRVPTEVVRRVRER